MAFTGFKQWYATVNRNGDVENVPVRKTKTREDNQFTPQNYKDFSFNVLYSVKTAMNDVEGKEQRYYAWIGRLAGNLEELNNNKKRISWPIWPSDINDEPNNTSQDEAEKQTKAGHSSVLACREKVIQKQFKKRIAAEEYGQFLHNYNVERTLDSSNKTNNSSGQTTAHSSDSANQSITTTSLIKDLKGLLEERIKEIEEKIEEKIDQIGKKTEEKIAEVLQQNLKMEEILSKFDLNTSDNAQYVIDWLHNLSNHSRIVEKSVSGSSNSMDSARSMKTDEKVHLGSEFYCERANFYAMQIAKNDCDWSTALLTGVFDENAKLMRVYPRKSELKKFPLNFLVLAQNLYRERLKQNNYEGEIEKKIKSLPAYLSDRALDLAGARGTSSRIKRSWKCLKNNKDDTLQRKKKKIVIIDSCSTSASTSNTVVAEEEGKELVSENVCIRLIVYKETKNVRFM